MENGCDHSEGSLMGQCAVCSNTVCSECHQNVFGAVICDTHGELEDESAWAIVGFYLSETVAAAKKFALDEHGMKNIIVEGSEDSIEVYVPLDEKDDAFSMLMADDEEGVFCSECVVQFSGEAEACPLCGGKPSDSRDATDQVH